MEINFYKYHGTGNDFILVDNRKQIVTFENEQQIQSICHRQFGIGSDGLILLENSKKAVFKMVYFNADGSTGSMCGNGARCIVAFAKYLKIIIDNTTFESAVGIHKASIDSNHIVSLALNDVAAIKEALNYTYLNTGSPHHIIFSDDISNLNIINEGRKIRYSSLYPNGTNVNFVEQVNENTFQVRTYERGVENETLSCGTGVVAVAISAYNLHKTYSRKIHLVTKGGTLTVQLEKENNKYTNLVLVGPTKLVYSGIIKI